jgi:hypothetical protein
LQQLACAILAFHRGQILRFLRACRHACS